MSKRDKELDLIDLYDDEKPASRKISVDDLELEDFNPFDVLDDDYEADVPAKQDRRTSQARRKKSKKKTNPVLLWLGRIGAVLGTTLLVLFVFLYAVMAVLVYGPSKTAKVQFVLSVQETSGIYWLANWYCSQAEIDQIKADNSIKDTDEVTDTDLVTINVDNTDTETPDLQVIDIKGATYSGKLMIVKDPSRLFVGTVPSFGNFQGTVVSEIAARYSAIAGINGGEFVDGADTYTAQPVGLVMKDGQVLNDNGGTSHVTGITYDNKLVVGNMNASKAKELNIRDCVSISNSIGPFLVVNGEAQDVSGIAGGLNPRTAIGQTADGKILLLAIDGRQVNSLGASFSDLQDIMVQYGAVNASTMDGGTSTQMYYNGEVINVPYSPTGPRSCPTAFLIK